MAEIKIEKKKSIWPWILLGLVILAVVLYFLFFKNKTENATTSVSDTTAVAIHNGNDTVTDYINFVNGDTSKMALDHSYSSQALIKLVQATQAMANNKGYDVKADLDQARDYANQITKNPLETNHADKIKKAAQIISTSLQNIQMAKYPALNMEAEGVKSAASNINPDVLTLDQKQAVQLFFDKAAMLLQKMN